MKKGFIKKSLIFTTFIVFVLTLISCTEKEEYGDDIPLTDLAATYEGEATDEDGNLLAPFDVVYPEAFNSGDFEYDKNAVLIKMSKAFDGKLTKNLVNCGMEKIEKFMSGVDSDWYRATIKSDTDVTTVVMKTRSLKEVLMVDYDYVYQNTTTEEEYETVGPSVDCKDRLHEPVKKNEHVGQQWYLTAGDIQKAWHYLEKNGVDAGGSSSVTVAVIDTGVDYTHPDLETNMWTNVGEIPGNGIDDDENGYVDDIHGVNVIANNGYGDMENVGNPMDDHGHGTHVAGIIAAANNHAGVVGIAYNAKIMAVKAGQATGIFLQSDIAEGILYAYQMGADVINMSFGGSACSIAVQDALTQAYTTATLVASAGNDGKPNQPTDYYPTPLPNYPAALNYVIGVMSVNYQGVESNFTNWDVYEYNTIEYELYAPGEAMISTLPGERYGKLSGTSMAAPVVSGVAALLRSYFTDRDMYPSKFIAAQLAATSEITAHCFNPEKHTIGGMPHNLPMIVSAYNALTKLPKPDVKLNNYYLLDSEELSEKNNGDGVIDAGETVNIAPVLRNRWGMSKDTVITIDSIVSSATGLENPYVEIITDSVNYGGVGTYSTKDALTRDGSIVTGCDLPLVIKIADNCPNDYLINLNVKTTAYNALDEDDKAQYVNYQEAVISFVVRNGVVLPSQITEDMTLTKDNYYIIPNATYIAEGVTVTVEEGTQIQFWSDDPKDPYADTYIAYLNVAGNFITKGTVEEPVKLFPSGMMDSYIVEIKKSGNGYVSLEYTTVTNPAINIDYADHCTFNQNYVNVLYYRHLSGGRVQTNDYGNVMINATLVENSLVYKLSGRYYGKAPIYGSYISCAFVDSEIDYNVTAEDCIFIGNNLEGYNSSMISRYFNVGFNKVFYDNNTGTSYAIIHFNYSKAEFIQEFLDSIGGHYAYIETQEELDFLLESLGKHDSWGYRIGLDPVSMTWGNGEKYDLDIQITKNIQENGKEAYSALRSYYESSESGYVKFVDVSYSPLSSVLVEIPGEVYCNDIIINESSVSIDAETNYQINVFATPVDVDTSKFVYVSSDNTVATVDEKGLVTPLREGEVTIYVYSPDFNVSEKCTINIVAKVPLKAMEAEIDRTQIGVGDSQKINVTLSPTNTTERFVTYSSSDTSIATVDNSGVVTAHSVGTATITITAKDLVKTIEITTVKAVESISFIDKNYLTYIGDTDESWLPSISPIDATNQSIVWESSNPEVAYVDEENNLVRVAEGNTTIRATIENTDIYDDLHITVNANVIDSSVNVIQMDEYDGLILAVLDDNSLWMWGYNIFSLPMKVLDNVKSIQIAGHYGTFSTGLDTYQRIRVYVVNTNGHLISYYFDIYVYADRVEIEVDKEYSLNKIDKITSYGGTSILFREDGTIWAFGDNDYGQLGDGTTINRDEPVQMLVDNVIDAVACGDYTAVLDTNGDLYVFGTDEKYTEAKLVAQNVEKIVRTSYHEMIVYFQDGTIKMMNEQLTFYSYWDYQIWYGEHWVSVDGVLKNTNNSLYDCTNVTNIKEVFAFNELAYILTEDGKFYGVGNNEKKQLANLNNIKQYKPTRIFFGLDSDSSTPSVEEVNLTDDILLEESITLDFDRAVIKGNQYGYITIVDSQNNYLSVNKNLGLDKLQIKINELVQGETYTLTIPANAIASVYGVANEEIVYTFTYQNNTEIELIESTLVEDAVFESQEFSAEFTYNFALQGTEFNAINITNNEELVEGITISLNDSILTISGVLEYGDYTLTIPSGALKDNVGGVNEEVVINFKVAQTLKLLESSIADGEDRVSETDDITLTFTDATVSTNFDLIKLIDSNNQTVDIILSLENNVLTISHDGLVQGQTYTLKVPANAVIDALGNPNKAIAITFTTYEPIAIIHSSIADENIALEPTFKLYLNGNVSVDSSKFALTLGEALVNVNVELVDRIVMITPVESLISNQEYTLTVAEGAIVDERGALNPVYQKTFKTIKVDERFYWTKDNLKDSYAPWKYHNMYFSNNAILNNFNDTNVEHWLRIQGQETSSKEEVGMAGNYWGTTDEVMINKQIIDFDDYQSLQDIVIGKYLTVAPSNTFPFVTKVTLYNVDGDVVTTVSNETVRFVVEFNRDMDVTVPLRVRFGSSMPYAEYEIPGEFTSSRVWEGTYTLKTTIENGNQYFNISNGRAASDHYLGLYETLGRFTFEIDTYAAQAMIMQANATEEGIHLTWMQDDFDTLAGYNVYRSDKEDGYYQRLNDYVLSSDTKEFFDDTVEPGMMYYYNFTVVKTDLTESLPSGKVMVRSLDTMAPNIYHTPVHTAYTNSNLLVSATITDNLQITSAYLYYRVLGSTEWKSVMMNGLNSRFTGVISSDYITVDGLEYYIKAFDGISYTYKGSEEDPFTVTVKLAVDKNSMGDVDGDGIIAIKDALMLLQAANDQLNLTEEQFMRADLNEDGILSASEALRILQYVSGKITSILE